MKCTNCGSETTELIGLTEVENGLDTDKWEKVSVYDCFDCEDIFTV